MNLIVVLACVAWFPMQDAAKPPQGQTTPPKAQGVYEVQFEPMKYVVSEVYTAADAGVPKTVEEAIALALQMHPDIRLAEAEMRVAEAKLAQARLLVTQKVTQDYQRLKEAQTALTRAEATFAQVQEQSKKGEANKNVVSEISLELLQAKSQVARQESLWKLVIPHGNLNGKCADCHQGSGNYRRYPVDLQPEVKTQTTEKLQLVRSIYQANTNLTLSKDPASVMEQLKEHLDKPINLEKQSKLELSQAFARLSKEAGIALRVKLPVTENKENYKDITRLELDAAQLPLHTWLQLIVDETNNMQSMLSGIRNDKPKRYDLYVREYGLLLTSTDLAPPEAKTVQEVWKQVRAEKAAREQEEKLAKRKQEQSKGTPPK